MKQELNINLKSIEAFSQISDSRLIEIEKSAEFYKYPFGQPICSEGIIPNKVLLIIKGNARLYSGSVSESSTITILNSGSFIGLVSILRADGCEQVSASNDLLVMSIPDKLIIEIYQEEVYFKNWCQEKIFPAEAFKITQEVYRNLPKSNFDINQLYKLISSNSILKGISEDFIPTGVQLIRISAVFIESINPLLSIRIPTT